MATTTGTQIGAQLARVVSNQVYDATEPFAVPVLPAELVS